MLVKVFKVIFVMLMGKFVFWCSYEYWEYLIVIFIFIGVSMFLLFSGLEFCSFLVIIFLGFILLVGYIVFDSFILNW